MVKLAVNLLGPMRVLVDDQIIDAAFRTKKERALLAYLAFESHKQHRREVLAELLWPGRPEGYARTNLRQALVGLRRALGSDALIGSDEYLSFGLASSTWLDSQSFLNLIQTTQSHKHRNLEACEACIHSLEEAVALYRGDFLEDMLLPDSQSYQEWVVFQREHFFRLFLGAIRSLSDFHQAQGNFERAYHYAWEYVNSAPLEESAHRQLMTLLALSGRRSAALEQYLDVCQILERELGVEPSRETTLLYEKIRDGVSLESEPARPGLQMTNLPAEMTSFVNRADEMEQILAYLTGAQSRLVGLVGEAGSGKTRLAVHSAALLLDKFPDGVWFVNLQDVYAIKLLAARIGLSMGMILNESEDYRSQLQRLLRPLKALLILDPFEHILHAIGFLIELCQQAPGVKILITSRRHLNHQAINRVEVSGLAYPLEEQSRNPLEYPAVELFLMRAQQNRNSVPVSEIALEKIVEVCQIVDGLPLAIELAATALRKQSLDALLDDLHEGLDVLSVFSEDGYSVHQSMRAALQISWPLLTEEEQTFFQRLTIFEGEFSAEMAGAEVGASPGVLNGLVDQSLLKRVGLNSYRMSPLMRLFGLEKAKEKSSGVPEDRASFKTIPLRRRAPKVKTGPMNLELFWDRLEHSLARAQRHKHAAALILLDVKNWATTSSTSEIEGRKLLQEAGSRISSALRGTDTVSYLGGARFAVVLDELTTPMDTQVVTVKLIQNLDALAVSGAASTVNMGMAIFPRDGSDAVRLYGIAQERLTRS